MAVATGGGYIERPKPSGLADVLEVILDKGLVVDIYLRVALVGIEILTVDARIVVASVDTYLRFAEAVGRLNIEETGDSQGLPQLVDRMTSGGAQSKTRGALEGVKESLFGGEGDEEDDSGSSGSGRGRSGSSSSRGRSGSSSGSQSGSRSRSQSS